MYIREAQTNLSTEPSATYNLFSLLFSLYAIFAFNEAAATQNGRAPDKFSIEQVNGAMGLCNRRTFPCPIYFCGAEQHQIVRYLG